MIRYGSELNEDLADIETLLDLAFGPGRYGLSAYRLRESVDPLRELSVVARDESRMIAGSIRFWPISIGDSLFPALLLGPVAVHPIWQGEGIGSRLILAGISKARYHDQPLIVLVGDEPYYSRFGFRKNIHLEFPPPTDPDRVLSLELTPDYARRARGLVQKRN